MGAYAVINKEFASHLPEKYTYVNRRGKTLVFPVWCQVKLSYNPVHPIENRGNKETCKIILNDG